MSPWVTAIAAVVADVINWLVLFASLFMVGAIIYIYIDNHKKDKKRKG